MLTFKGRKGVEFCDGMHRRDFLRVGSLAAGAVGLSLADMLRLERAKAAARAGDMNCIILFLVGGPSQLDTWDLKPGAPDTIRGPFNPIKTNVPGIEICEHFPLMAKMADKYALVRSVHHDAAPIHETGHQMMQTGRLFRGGQEHPHYGAVVSHLQGRKKPGMPASVTLPYAVANTGVSISHGQGAGYLGRQHEPFVFRGEVSSEVIDASAPASVDPARLQTRTTLVDAVDAAQITFDASEETRSGGAYEQAFGLIFAPQAKKAFDVAPEPDSLRSRYGHNTFGQSCLLARRLVEQGVRLVTVNMFDTVFNHITWDCHADGGSLAVKLEDYQSTLCPMFDRAYSSLLDDLGQRGMLENTMVVAMGEFGRTPQLNLRGGRDHWPNVWTILFAGGKVQGGQVIGASDKTGSEPKDRPLRPAEVAATIYHGLGIDLNTGLPGLEGESMPLVDAEPVMELFS